MSISSASVGFCPRDRMTVPSSLVVIVPEESQKKTFLKFGKTCRAAKNDGKMRLSVPLPRNEVKGKMSRRSNKPTTTIRLQAKTRKDRARTGSNNDRCGINQRIVDDDSCRCLSVRLDAVLGYRRSLRDEKRHYNATLFSMLSHCIDSKSFW